MIQQLLTKSPEKAHQLVGSRESSSALSQSFRGRPIYQLQRMMGNRLVTQLIQAKRLTPQGAIIGLQRKLIVGGTGDSYEQEADRVARQVMNTPDAVATASAERAPSLGGAQIQTPASKAVAASVTPMVQGQIRKQIQAEEGKDSDEEKEDLLQAKRFRESLRLQRKIATEEEEEEADPIQAKTAGVRSSPFEADTDVQKQVNLSKGRGSPLPDPVRAYMEPRFGVNFSHVQVHTGNDARQLNRAVGAQAFTHGSDIYFGAGHDPTDLELTAHELTHVVQQAGGVSLRTNKLAEPCLTIDARIQRAAAAFGIKRIKEQDSELDSAVPLKAAEQPSNKSSIPPQQPVDVEKTSAPQAKEEIEFLPAVEERGSEDRAAEAPAGRKTFPPLASRGKAPATPEEDSSYLAIVDELEVKAKTQKTPFKKPKRKQEETKLAANLTPEEIGKQNAYDQHLLELAKIQPNLTVEKFMDEFKATANNLAGKLPADKDQQGKMRTGVNLSVAKLQAIQEVANQRNAHADSLRTEAAKPATNYQDTGKQASKPYQLQVDPPGSVPTLPSAKGAAPKPKTDAEIYLDDQSQSLDNALSNHEVNGQSISIAESSLAFPISGEKTFDEAGEAKRKAQDEIAKGKPRYRDAEGGLIRKSQEDIHSLVNTGLAGHHESRSTSFKEVLSTQKEHGSIIEGQKRSIFTQFEGIYTETKRKVNGELETLNGIEETFQHIISQAEDYFNRLVRNDLEYIYTPGVFDYSDWKDKHEDEIKAEFERQRVLNRDDDMLATNRAYAKALQIVRGRSADILFANAKTIFIGQVNREVQAKIATKVVEALNAAKKHIRDGKEEVNKAFASLDPKEQEEARNVVVAVTGKFEQLEESVADRQREIVGEMARIYNDSVGKLKTTFDAIRKDVLTGWLEKAWNKLKAVVNAIIDFATRIAELLGRLVHLVADIVSSPRRFFSNLVTGIGQGFSTFANQIDTFLATAFFDWLRGSSGLAIQMPKDWGPKGIFSLFTQLLNLSAETVWERMAIVYDKTIANAFRRGEVLLDKGLEIFALIKNEGLGGLWDHIQESLGNILEETLRMIKENVLYAAIKKVILEIGKLLVPGGGFIAIAEKVIRLLQFIAEARNKILDLIESFVDSVKMAVEGNIPGIVKHITGALTKFITVALDFLVALFGLGALKEKVTRFIERMRKPVIRGIDWVLGKFKPLVMKGAKFIEKGKEKVIGAGKAVVQVGVPKDPNERLRLAARASVSAARRQTGRVTQALLNPLLAGIKLRYGLRALQPYEKGGTWWVKATANPELDQDLGVTAEVIDRYIELMGTGMPLEGRKKLLDDVRAKIGDHQTLKSIFDLRAANAKMKPKTFRNLLQQIVDEDLKGGFRITEEVESIQGKSYLLLHYYGLNKQGANPVISPVVRGGRSLYGTKGAVGLAWVEDRKLNMDFLLPLSIKAMNVRGAGTKLFKLAEARFRSEVDAIQATWTRGQIYKNVTIHHMSDNLKMFLDVYNRTNDAEEGVKATWTYEMAKKEGYDRVSDIQIIKDKDKPEEIFAVKVKLERTTPTAGS